MIAHLTGQILLATDKALIIKAGEIGYKVIATTETILTASRQEKLSLWIHTHVREDALELYGFLERRELEMFERLISISGIGPKGAIGILSLAPVESLRTAIGRGDLSYLTKVSGIGKKTAEKIILELRDKVGRISSEEQSGDEDVLEGLKALGFSERESRETLRDLPKDLRDAGKRITAALKILNSGKR